MDLILAFPFFLLGLAVGSFINMAEYRWAKKNPLQGETLKRSFCDGCGRQLSWGENIPVVSWLWLGGRSKCCGTPLPWQYPVIELLTGGLFVFVFLQPFPEWIMLWVELGIVTGLVFTCLVDLKYQIILDEITGLLVVLALIWNILNSSLGWENLISAGAIFLFFLILFLITKGKGMGFGDVKFVVFMGVFLGGWGTLIAVYTAFIFGALVGVLLMLFKKYGRKSVLPFGPFLIVGTLIAWWAGSGLQDWIKGWLFGRIS